MKIFLSLSLLATVALAQEKVKLVDGKSLDGKVIQSIPAQVVIETPTGKVTIPVTKLDLPWVRQNLGANEERETLESMVVLLQTSLRETKEKLARTLTDYESMTKEFEELRTTFAARTKNTGILEMDVAKQNRDKAATLDGQIKFGPLRTKLIEHRLLWRVTVTNESPMPLRVSVGIRGRDKEGFLVQRGAMSGEISLAPRATHEFEEAMAAEREASDLDWTAWAEGKTDVRKLSDEDLAVLAEEARRHRDDEGK